MRPSVAVVVPAYNVSSFVTDALESIRAQTRRPDHLVVVDDGSTDNTAAVVERWSQENEFHVDLLRQRNHGLAVTRNRGIDHAEDADLIALLDADDIWEPHHLERMVSALEAHPSVVLAFADLSMFGDASASQSFLHGKRLSGKRLAGVPFKEDDRGFRILTGDVFSSLLPGNYILPSATVFRREAARRAGLFDPAMRRCEDRDLMLRMTHQGKFGYFPSTHVRRRIHGNNLTHPRGRLEYGTYRLRALVKARESADAAGLSRDQLRNLAEAFKVQTWEVLYLASREGIPAYFANLARVMRSGSTSAALNPKHFARAIATSLGIRREDRFPEREATASEGSGGADVDGGPNAPSQGRNVGT